MNDVSGISQQVMSIEFLILAGAFSVHLLESFEARDATGEGSQEGPGPCSFRNWSCAVFCMAGKWLIFCQLHTKATNLPRARLVIYWGSSSIQICAWPTLAIIFGIILICHYPYSEWKFSGLLTDWGRPP